MALFRMSSFYWLSILCTLNHLVLATPTRRQAAADCYPSLSHAQKGFFHSGQLPCQAVPADAVPTGSFKVSTSRWLTGPDTAATFDDQASKRLENANKGIQKAAAAYAEYVKDTPLTVNLVYVPGEAIDPWGTTNFADGTSAAQRIFSVLVADWKSGFNPDQDKWARTTAHEFYHCVLLSTNAEDLKTTNSFNKWWDEGGPTFFATALFPESLDPNVKQVNDPSHSTLNIQAKWQQYRPEKSMYLQENTASLLFLDMYTRPTNDRQNLANIHSYLSQQIMTGSPAAEQTRLGNDPFLPDHFRVFAKRYVDDTIKLTRDDATTVTSLSVYKADYKESMTVNKKVGVSASTWTAAKLVSYSFVRLDLSLQAPDTKNKITYTISVTNRSPKTKVYYRLKTCLKWSELKAGKTTKKKAGCGSGAQNYIFLFVSTDPTNPLKPVINVKPTSSTKCPSQAARRSLGPRQEAESCPIDNCIDGTWSLDLATLKAAMEAALAASSSSATISNIKVEGSSTFTYSTSDATASMAFDHTLISYDAEAEGFQFHTDIDVTGSASGPVAEDGDDSFHWTAVTGEGQFNTATTLQGDTTPIELDLPLTSAYSTDVEVQYECEEDTLTLKGLQDGNQFWIYSYTREDGTA